MRILILTLPAVVASPVWAEGPPVRKPRPPPDYSKRVQFHELPITVSPPEDLDKKDDPLKIDARTAPQLAPESSPLVIAPTLLTREPDGPRPNLREMRKEPPRRSDRRSGSTGWGWLADDIATNRARRADRDARQRAREETDEDMHSQSDESEPYARVKIEDEQRQEPRTGDNDNDIARRRRDEPRAFDMRWLDINPVVDELLPERPARQSEGLLDNILDRRMPESVVNFTPNAAGVDRRLPLDVRGPDERDAPGRGAVARPASEGIRPWRDESIWPIERPGESGVRVGWGTAGGALDFTPTWSVPSLQPLQLSPSDISLTPTPIMTPPNGAMNAAPTAPSLSGIGGERERVTPRTLPW